MWSMDVSNGAVANALRNGLRTWGRQRRGLDSMRDTLVCDALEVGITKEEIHILTGLGRTTIDRIEKGKADG